MDFETRAFITLAAAAVNQYIPSIENIEAIDYDTLFKIASFHNMTGIIDVALESMGISNPVFQQERYRIIRKNAILDNERESVFHELEKAHIWYMPLKGIILQDYYPQTGMRQMSDNDILFDASRAEDVKQIMEALGFHTIHFGKLHQDDYQKPPVSHFEMHRMLFSSSSEECLYKYYNGIKFEEKLIVKTDYERSFSNEDFYIYMVAHEYKHYYWRGTGLRSLLDVYVFLNKHDKDLNWDYIKKEIQDIGISSFEEDNRILAFKVFGQKKNQLSEKEMQMLERFVLAGIYGTKEFEIQNKIIKKGKIKYILERIFLSGDSLKYNYPFFYKHKAILPLLPFYRLIRSRDKGRSEFRIIKKK